jgi:imidazolonepropionase-like amidohydrolase/ABC-type multidrug transport system permease subunit
MNSYLVQTEITLKLTFRDKTVVFFNYLFPLVFFFIFAQLFHAEQGGAIFKVLTMVLTIGVLGTGFFGAGIRAVMDREANILRRFKVAPTSAAPILVASLITGLFNFLPAALLMVLLSHFRYGMPFPERWFSLLIFLSLGVLAFRALGLIIASVVNSMQESQIVIQILYFPMLFLSGATIPIEFLPSWVQAISQGLPSTHLMTGMQAILVRKETIVENWSSALALIVTVLLGTLIGVKLFRWEKGEKTSGSAKLWLLAVLGPFLLLGAWQAHSRSTIAKAKMLDRDQRRSRAVLIRGPRIFVGDGKVIESGSVLIRDGKIAQVYEGQTPDAKDLRAELIEASGKTLLPGFIDMHVHLGAPGGFSDSAKDYDAEKNMPRELAAYLYSGVMAVKSVGDPLDAELKVRTKVNSGERLGAELFACGPMFTAPGGHGTEYFKRMPQQVREEAARQTVRTPRSADEARKQVDELSGRGLDCIKAILEAGQAGMLFNRMDVGILRGVAEQARARMLTLAVHTGEARDVGDALAVQADSIEHGSFRDSIPDELFARMKAQGTAYDPTLAVAEAFQGLAAGDLSPLSRPLVLQVGPANMIESTKRLFKKSESPGITISVDQGKRNLVRAWRAGVLLMTGTDSGNPLLLHGPALHRELQLWVEAGIPPAVALQAATYNAARVLRAEERIGLIRAGREANLVLVDGNPLEDIKRTEGIQTLFFRGEHVDRPDLFDQE